jgi:hypothetical protein
LSDFELGRPVSIDQVPDLLADPFGLPGFTVRDGRIVL